MVVKNQNNSESLLVDTRLQSFAATSPGHAWQLRRWERCRTCSILQWNRTGLKASHASRNRTRHAQGSDDSSQLASTLQLTALLICSSFPHLLTCRGSLGYSHAAQLQQSLQQMIKGYACFDWKVCGPHDVPNRPFSPVSFAISELMLFLTRSSIVTLANDDPSRCSVVYHLVSDAECLEATAPVSTDQSPSSHYAYHLACALLTGDRVFPNHCRSQSLLACFLEPDDCTDDLHFYDDCSVQALRQTTTSHLMSKGIDAFENTVTAISCGRSALRNPICVVASVSHPAEVKPTPGVFYRCSCVIITHLVSAREPWHCLPFPAVQCASVRKGQ